MAYATAEVLSTMEVDSGIEMTELRVDGGAAINDWLMTFQAGLVRVPVQRPPLVEMTALGAAGLAGLSQGVWATAEDFRLSQGKPDQFDSIMPEAEAFRLKQGWARAVRAATHWARDSSE
jgi:glycerol kinase